MLDMTEHAPTKDDIMRAGTEMLEVLRDGLDELLAQLPDLPKSRDAFIAALDRVERAGPLCWILLETYIRSIDCEGNA